MSSTEQIESLKLKLMSVTKLKLKKESEVFKLRKLERCLEEELLLTTSEIENIAEQIQNLKNQITQTTHQISMIEICKSSETTKINAHIENVYSHKNGFDEMFFKETSLSESRNRVIREKEETQLLLEQQKNEEIMKKNEEQALQAACIEKEAIAYEKECAVLRFKRQICDRFDTRQKRNNAIMLKLRRKLLETESARRELTKRNSN